MSTDRLPRQVPGPCAMPAMGRGAAPWDPHGVAEWRVGDAPAKSTRRRWWRLRSRRRTRNEP